MADEKKNIKNNSKELLNGIERFSLPTIAKEFIAGGVAGGVAKSAVAPLERVKILFQTRKTEFQSIGLLGSSKKIFRTEGLLGFYKGNGASVARIVPYAALHYMAYEQYRRWVILGFPNVNRGPVLDLVAGSMAGGTAVICTYPLDLVRTKLAYQVVNPSKLKFKGLSQAEHVYEGILDCLSKIYRTHGIRGLYRGVGPTLYGIFPYAGLKFYFYEEMKTRIPEERKNDIMMKLACGSIAGLLGQTLTYPLDVVRRQMQVQALSTANSVIAKGTFESLVMIIKHQGWRQLFSGLSINYLKRLHWRATFVVNTMMEPQIPMVVPSVAIGFTVYDTMKLWLRVPSRDETSIPRLVSEESSSSSSLPSG